MEIQNPTQEEYIPNSSKVEVKNDLKKKGKNENIIMFLIIRFIIPWWVPSNNSRTK